MRPFLTLALLALVLPACDGYDLGYDDGYDDGQNDRPQVRVVDFELDADSYAVSSNATTATFESDDIVSNSDRDALTRALSVAGDGALVAAYIDTDQVIESPTQSAAWSALPLSRTREEEVQFDVDGDGDLDTILVPLVASYEYSFDNEDFYFDIVSSVAGTEYGDPRDLFDSLIPGDLRLRVVTIPADILNKTIVDLTNYEEVRAAFNLPD